MLALILEPASFFLKTDIVINMAPNGATLHLFIAFGKLNRHAWFARFRT